jgi:hypothetical protein
MPDLGNACIECGCDTAFGSGNFVNRVPADNGTDTGFLCVECQSIPCDKCGEPTLDYQFVGGDILCPDCTTTNP